jgi:hypothetical protein
MSNHFRIEKSNRLFSENFIKIFESWADLNDKYIDVSDGDECAYFFSERTNCAMLNAAAYKVDGVVSLIEVPVERKRSFSGVKSGSGHYDLYIYDGIHSYLIETKQSWYIDKLPDRIKETEKQVKSIKNDHKHDLNLSVVFSVARYKNVDKNIVEDHIKIISKIAQDANVDGVFHYYPKKAMDIIGWRNYIYPGVSILISVVE